MSFSAAAGSSVYEFKEYEFRPPADRSLLYSQSGRHYKSRSIVENPSDINASYHVFNPSLCAERKVARGRKLSIREENLIMAAKKNKFTYVRQFLLISLGW